MNYPKSYHDACYSLVAFGGSRPSNKTRANIARALKFFRGIDRKKATRERRHLLFIAGCFPPKEYKTRSKKTK